MALCEERKEVDFQWSWCLHCFFFSALSDDDEDCVCCERVVLVAFYVMTSAQPVPRFSHI